MEATTTKTALLPSHVDHMRVWTAAIGMTFREGRGFEVKVLGTKVGELGGCLVNVRGGYRNGWYSCLNFTAPMAAIIAVFDPANAK